MKYAYKKICDSYPKTHIESIWSKWVPRKLSFPVAYLLVNMGCSAWLASLVSIVVAIIACILICVPSSTCRWLGIAAVVMWQVLDCVDGTIARTTKKASAMGEFIDAQSGYTIMAFIYFAVGIAAFNTTHLFTADNRILLIIVGSISSISNILARLLNTRFIYCDLKKKLKDGKQEIEIPNEDIMPKDFFGKIRVLADFHLGLAGIFVPLLIISEILSYYDILTLGYCIYSFAGFLFATILYTYKAKNNT